MRICSQRTAQRCCYRERFSRHLCEGWTLTAKGFKERGLAFLIGDAGARTIIHQKSAQILRSGLTLGQGGRRGRKRTKADGFGLQYLPPRICSITDFCAGDNASALKIIDNPPSAQANFTDGLLR